ncbi:MAG: methylated-DNA--[protein]-cysteine S-methyltransferase [Kiritimatiellales bacterium]|nr:methylated-DNA--[protein]-cysteine S-methyltransferase [Kiritimatiellales bacterium]
MSGKVQRLAIDTSWGILHIELVDGKVSACTLPMLAEQPEQPFAVMSNGRDAASVFVRGIFAGTAGKMPPLGKPAGTEFQQQVWQAIAAIPFGQTRTYSELAAAIGRPRAVRAVGSACGRNPLPLFIPCHRVLAANGKPGGFSAGLPWKKLLLRCERSI